MDWSWLKDLFTLSTAQGWLAALLSYGWVWFMVTALGFFALVNQHAHSAQLGKLIEFGCLAFILGAALAWVLNHLPGSSVVVTANWGPHWFWPVALWVVQPIWKQVLGMLPVVGGGGGKSAAKPAVHH